MNSSDSVGDCRNWAKAYFSSTLPTIRHWVERKKYLHRTSLALRTMDDGLTDNLDRDKRETFFLVGVEGVAVLLLVPASLGDDLMPSISV